MDNNFEQEKQKEIDSFFEFHNYWSMMRDMKRFELFSIAFIDDIFAFDNCIQIIIFNFEFRFYFKKLTTNKI